MSDSENILEAIEAILREDQAITEAPEPPLPWPPLPKIQRRQAPRVGTYIQRSDATNQRKLAILATPPPPLTPRRRQAASKLTQKQAAKEREPEVTKQHAGKPDNGHNQIAALNGNRKIEEDKESQSKEIHRQGSEERQQLETQETPQKERRPPPQETPIGPSLPPPVQVEIEPGYEVEIPYFSVHVSNRYKIRTPRGRYTLRFTKQGQLYYKRKMSD